jgi:3-oxoacyl-[acyl-carrier protein] reductase
VGDLTGKVAVVTGSSRGLGRAIVRKVADMGAQVVVNYRSDQKAAQETLQLIERAGGAGIVVKADVSVYDQAQELINAALAHYGRLDILVNNAGTTRDNLLVRMSEADWDLVLNTNLKSVFACCKAAQRTMMRQRYGRIVNITSIAGVAGNAGQTNYAASKAGMIGFTKSLAKEVGSRNITVNAVAPGYIPTDLSGLLPPELIAKGIEMTPLGRSGTADDIANAVAFLVSDAAGFITGQVLSVDGGLAMQ